MPINYGINTELNVLIYVFSGLVTGDDYFNAYQKAYKDSRRTHGMRVLVDLLPANSITRYPIFGEG